MQIEHTQRIAALCWQEPGVQVQRADPLRSQGTPALLSVNGERSPMTGAELDFQELVILEHNPPHWKSKLNSSYATAN